MFLMLNGQDLSSLIGDLQYLNPAPSNQCVSPDITVNGSCFQELCDTTKVDGQIYKAKMDKFIDRECLEDFYQHGHRFKEFVKKQQAILLADIRAAIDVLSNDFDIKNNKSFSFNASSFMGKELDSWYIDDRSSPRKIVITPSSLLASRSKAYQDEVNKCFGFIKSNLDLLGLSNVISNGLYSEKEYNSVYAEHKKIIEGRYPNLIKYLQEEKLIAKVSAEVNSDQFFDFFYRVEHFMPDRDCPCEEQCKEIVFNEIFPREALLEKLESIGAQISNFEYLEDKFKRGQGNYNMSYSHISMTECIDESERQRLSDLLSKSMDKYKNLIGELFSEKGRNLDNFFDKMTVISPIGHRRISILNELDLVDEISSLSLNTYLKDYTGSPDSYRDRRLFIDSNTILSLDDEMETLGHELTHAIFEYFQSDNSSAAFKDSFQRVMACVATIHNHPSVATLEEDMADTLGSIFASTITPKAESPTCRYLREERNLSLEFGYDLHSPTLFRAIYTSFLRGHYPESCKRAINSDHRMRRCLNL
jgi:hypothetical protein